MKRAVVIYNKGESKLQNEPMFWSASEGWTSLDNATVYVGGGEPDKLKENASVYAGNDKLNLPVGDSEWMNYDEASKLFDEWIEKV